MRGGNSTQPRPPGQNSILGKKEGGTQDQGKNQPSRIFFKLETQAYGNQRKTFQVKISG